jgi:hypothetical protein
MLKAHPELLNDWQARAWCKFFCLSVYVTMYLNDHQRTAFYESLGLNTTQVRKYRRLSDILPAPLSDCAYSPFTHTRLAPRPLLSGSLGHAFSHSLSLTYSHTYRPFSPSSLSLSRSLSLSLRQFNRHVILETNKTTERLFPEVPVVDTPEFWTRMDDLVALNAKLSEVSASSAPDFVKNMQKVRGGSEREGQLVACCIKGKKSE